MQPLGQYSLGAPRRASSRASCRRATAASAVAGHLHLAFPLEGHDGIAAVCARQPDDPGRRGRARGDRRRARAPASAALDQVDAHPVARRRRARLRRGRPARPDDRATPGGAIPGLRPVLFHSPYEAAAWAVIGARIAIRQAARIKVGDGRERSATEVSMHGETLDAFPSPGTPGDAGRLPGPVRPEAGIPARDRGGRHRGPAGLDRAAGAPRRRGPGERCSEMPGIGPFSPARLPRAVGVAARARLGSRLPRAIALPWRPRADARRADGADRRLAAVPDLGDAARADPPRGRRRTRSATADRPH